MIPPFNQYGNLPVGIHRATWTEIYKRYGLTPWRKTLLDGFLEAAALLARAGCVTVYLDGSFATDKAVPGDFDVCWVLRGVDLNKLDPVLKDLDAPRATQKARFGGELLPGDAILQFFQRDREGRAKGIVALDLTKLKIK